MNLEVETTELDGRSIENPAYCNHHRGQNWASIMRGKNAANCFRQYLRTRGDIVDLEPVRPGDVVEFAGDYFTFSRGRRPNRKWFLIRTISDENLTFERYDTLAQALRPARVGSTGHEAIEQ